MSDLTRLFSVFSLPKKINALIKEVDNLLHNGPLQIIADTDSAFRQFLLDVKVGADQLMADASRFTWHDIGSWIADFEKLCKDASTIGLQVISLYEGIEVDPNVANSLGSVLSIIKDIAALLNLIGVNIPTPALSPVATKAVDVATPNTPVATSAPAPSVPDNTPPDDTSSDTSGLVGGPLI